jgi:hypothetical protein
VNILSLYHCPVIDSQLLLRISDSHSGKYPTKSQPYFR